MRRRLAVVRALGFLFSLACLGGGAVRGAPGAAPPSAEELVKAVQDSEEWLHQVDSFYVKFDVTWSKTLEAIEHRKAELNKQFPGAEINVKRFPELLPERPETLVVAFDRRRFYKHVYQPASSDRTSFWDGSRAIDHEKYFSHDQEHYAILAGPEKLGAHFLGEGSWPRAGHHSFWWH